MRRAASVFVMAIGVSWAVVASAQVGAVKGETDATVGVVGVLGKHNATTGTDPGVRGETNSTSGSAAGVTGIILSTTPGGFSAGVRGINNGTGGNGIGVWGSQAGSGWGVQGESSSGIGVLGTSAAAGSFSATSQIGVLGISGTLGLFGGPLTPAGVGVWGSSSTGTGVVAGVGGAGTGLYVDHVGSIGLGGDLALFQANGFDAARIDKTGKGFFNGGTQTGGADLAEAFEVEGDRDDYEPGDVLAISTRSDRTLEKSSEPSSTLVAGVYATKPGVLLTDFDIEADASRRVPLGVVGVIPTKVSAENGAIRRGDLLVTAATPGHAMKAGATPAMGTVLGKALQDFAGPGTGIINVLVNVK